jgi:hypothetical protein
MLAQLQAASSGAGAGLAIGGFGLIFLVIYVVSLWKIFDKMGQPGWSGVIPILNYVIVARLSGKQWWYGLLPLVPCIGIIFVIILLFDLAKLFGHGVGFTIGLILLPILFLPILAFGQYQYQGPQEKII